MTLTTNTRPVDELEAGDEFRQTMVAKADADNHGPPMWHGWAIMEAFLAGIDYARKGQAAGWRPIETAPRDGTQIVGWSRYVCSVSVYAWDVRERDFVPMHEGSRVIEHETYRGTDYKGGGDVLSHWMPLPAPPEQK